MEENAAVNAVNEAAAGTFQVRTDLALEQRGEFHGRRRRRIRSPAEGMASPKERLKTDRGKNTE